MDALLSLSAVPHPSVLGVGTDQGWAQGHCGTPWAEPNRPSLPSQLPPGGSAGQFGELRGKRGFVPRAITSSQAWMPHSQARSGVEP